ncbi:MAG: PLDc_N domain-containing protein [Actinomycetales bacterium]|nr:PLDc_N domain-containing protein [Actinomycetales bacterium]
MARYLVPLVLIAIMIFTIVDIVLIDRGRVRAMPKVAWIALAVLLSVIGSILWFALGRVRLDQIGAGGSFGAPGSGGAGRPAPRRRGPVAPDDDPEFLARVRREQEQRDRIRELEERLAELEDDDPERRD